MTGGGRGTAPCADTPLRATQRPQQAASNSGTRGRILGRLEWPGWRPRRPRLGDISGMAAGGLGAAGYDPSLIPFLKERDITLLGNDAAQEGGIIPGVSIPIHTFTIVALGLNLLDNLALDELAATADKLKRWEFLLVVEPLRMQNGAGSPVNPVAVF
jgi:hypothetical protein